MIVTVTLTPAVDKTLIVPGFAVGKTNRGEIERLDPGGKGINVAKALKQLGCPVTALGFVAGRRDRITLVVPPAVKARSSVGAGDTLVAAFAYAMVEDLEFDAAVRLATAMGAATAAAGGSSVAGMDAVRAMLPQIVLTRLDEGIVQ